VRAIIALLKMHVLPVVT